MREWACVAFPCWEDQGLPSTTLYSFKIDFDLQVLYGGCLFLSVILNFIRATPSLVSPWAPCHKRFRLTNSIRFEHQKTSPGVLIITRHKWTSFGVPITTRH